jgi:protein-S-isoprenylcysteine O-methyltransferase Ste14
VRFFLAFKTLLFTVLVPGTVTVYIPYTLLSGSDGKGVVTNGALALTAGSCILIGIAIYLRCAWDFAVEGLGTPAPIDPPRKLVVTGIYRWNRNPMYQGVLLILLAECLLSLDSNLLVYTSSVALIFHAFVFFYEEPILNQLFGESYRHYCRIVPRWGIAFQPYPINPA